MFAASIDSEDIEIITFIYIFVIFVAWSLISFSRKEQCEHSTKRLILCSTGKNEIHSHLEQDESEQTVTELLMTND